MGRILLGVNIDHVATLRQARLGRYPDTVQAALMAEQAGADSITVHLREDRRHIQDHDVKRLQQAMLTPMNLEMAVTEEMLDIAEDLKPEYCCLVPEKREELTTEGGLDVVAMETSIKEACQRLKGEGIRVSLFIDADMEQIEASREFGADVVEIHTGPYADAVDEKTRKSELQKIITGVEIGSNLGLQMNAGHGLDYQNVQAVAAIPGIHELNIGHSIIARSVFTGLEESVKEIKKLMLEARH